MASLRPQTLAALLFIAILFSYCGFYVIPFVYYAWCQHYGDYTVLRVESMLTSNKTALSARHEVPKIIHQTWKDTKVPAQWMTTRAMCRRMYGDFKHMLWTNENSRELIATDYPWFLSTYDSYIYDIQRADAARYFILEKHGGVYLDMDVGCLKDINAMLMKYPMLLPITAPVGISNDVIISVPHHKFLEQVIHELGNWNRVYGTPFFTVFFSTGPAFLSYQAGLYLSSQQKLNVHSRTTSIDRSSLYFIDPALYSLDDGAALFYHVAGSSWHYADAAFLSFLYNNHYLVLFGILPTLICVFILLRVLFASIRGRMNGGNLLAGVLATGGVGSKAVMKKIRLNKLRHIKEAFADGLDPAIRERETGDTMLIVCAQNNLLKMAKLCKSNGCDMNAPNNSDMTPLDYCELLKHHELGDWFLDNGALTREDRTGV